MSESSVESWIGQGIRCRNRYEGNEDGEEYGTIVSLLDEAGKRRFLNCFGDVPLVLLNEQAEGYAGIEIDSRSGLKEVIEHLIDEHHLSRIGYVSGPQNNHDAAERLQVYREAMEAHGLDFNETYIAYGNFSIFSEEVIEELCKWHLDLEALVAAIRITMYLPVIRKSSGLAFDWMRLDGSSNSISAILRILWCLPGFQSRTDIMRSLIS